ncbi:phosphopantetheine-binding protein [Streptomyces seoulensis]
MNGIREEVVDSAFEAPADGLEQVVAAIVADVLSFDRVGRSDSFYDLGGTSLQAIRICARIEQRTGRTAYPEWLFTHDVLSEFVAHLKSEGEDGR